MLLLMVILSHVDYNIIDELIIVLSFSLFIGTYSFNAAATPLLINPIFNATKIVRIAHSIHYTL